jgi:hypothetical protein
MESWISNAFLYNSGCIYATRQSLQKSYYSSMSKASQAELAEELARVDQELKLLQKELEDVVFMNDEFTKKNDIKVRSILVVFHD